MLLNYTQKTSSGLECLGIKKELLYYPYDRSISRLKYKPDLFKYHLQCETVEEIGKWEGKSPNWDECCFIRANELLSLNKNKYFFSWSGGIDSSTALVSVFKHWPKDKIERIEIVLTHSSIEENPTFFKNYLIKFPLRNALANISVELLRGDSILVTGEMGDQLFGSDLLSFACKTYGSEILKRPYLECAADIIENQYPLLSEGAGKAIFEHFQPIVYECPFQIQTAFDFFWWFNFSQKWQHVKYRFVELPKWPLELRMEENIFHFFDSKYFQAWSLSNHDLKIRDTWDSYKFTAKNYLKEYTKDESQEHLKKKQSLKSLYSVSQKRIAVTEDYKEINNIEELEQYVKTK